VTDEAAATAWVDRYRAAWESNDSGAIADLFTPDASYFAEPFRAPWQGRDEIVRGWLEHRDEPGTTVFSYEVLAIADRLAFVRGLTEYTAPPPRTYSNLWVLELAEDGRASAFTEWWMAHD